MVIIVFKRYVWFLYFYRYINFCFVLFNILDGYLVKVVYLCLELLCNIFIFYKLLKVKLVFGCVIYDMLNYWLIGVSVYFFCRVMIKLVVFN